MTQLFDPAHPQVFFTSKFMSDHVYLGSILQKKKAENVFLRRFLIDSRRREFESTVLCMTRPEFALLAGEIHRRQSDFNQEPQEIFNTLQAFTYWSRGGTKSRDKKRATIGMSRFRYGVRRNGEGIYMMCHFDGLT